MFLVKTLAHHVYLRDRGDEKTKRVTKEGTLFLKAPAPDAVLEIVELSDEEAKAHVAKLDQSEREAALALPRKAVQAAEEALKAAKLAAEKAEADVVAAVEALEKAKKELSERVAAVTGTPEVPPAKPSKKERGS